MNRVNKPNKDGNIVIDFDRNVLAECRIKKWLYRRGKSGGRTWKQNKY